MHSPIKIFGWLPYHNCTDYTLLSLLHQYGHPLLQIQLLCGPQRTGQKRSTRILWWRASTQAHILNHITIIFCNFTTRRFRLALLSKVGRADIRLLCHTNISPDYQVEKQNIHSPSRDPDFQGLFGKAQTLLFCFLLWTGGDSASISRYFQNECGFESASR